MQQNVLKYVRAQRLMKAGNRVGVAVSGGPDSVALLRALLELRGDLGIVVVAVAHFNHKLRSEESEADERFVRELAEKHGLDLVRDEADTEEEAQRSGSGIEAAARELRYEFFADLLRNDLLHSANLDCIATGHTLDDQAETVLMRMLRGAGTRGLAAIRPQVRVGEKRVVRPLLGVRRSDVLAYLRLLGQGFRTDASNRDLKFLRNRIRHELLPLLEREYNPQVAEALAQMAEIARVEEQYWDRELSEAWREVARWRAEPGEGRGVMLDLAPLLRLPVALQRRLIQSAAEKLDVTPSFEQVESVRELASKHRGTVELADGVCAIRGKDELRMWVAENAAKEEGGYEYPLSIPGEVRIPELRSKIVIAKTAAASAGGGACASTSNGLTLRNWRPGDRFYPRHSSGPKKVKELLTDKKVTGRERSLWPVVAAGDRIVWLRGWGVAADAVAPAGSAGVQIEEVISAE